MIPPRHPCAECGAPVEPGEHLAAPLDRPGLLVCMPCAESGQCRSLRRLDRERAARHQRMREGGA